MNILKSLSLVFILIFIPLVALSKVNISNYQATFIPLYDETNNLNIAIRRYFVEGDLYFLCVDPNTLQTKTLQAKQMCFHSKNYLAEFKNFLTRPLMITPYIKLLYNFSQPPYQTQNYGITHASNKTDGVFVTVDMCPSTKKFEKRLFLALESQATKLHKPLPIAMSVSGLWILKHREEFLWLIEQQSKNKLAITWINHSFSHPYYPSLPIEKNFLITTQKTFEQEVLATEKLLLEYGQIPSIYFRFPGLVSNKKLIGDLKNLGLISIGSNAWLAKDEQPRNGSFILIHGNGNEPKGVDKFLLLLKQNTPNFLALTSQTIN